MLGAQEVWEGDWTTEEDLKPCQLYKPCITELDYVADEFEDEDIASGMSVDCRVECLWKHHMWWQKFYHPFSFSILPPDLIFCLEISFNHFCHVG